MAKLTTDQIKELLSNTLSQEERKIPLKLLEENPELSDLLQKEWEETSEHSLIPEDAGKRMWQIIRSETRDKKEHLWWWAAAIFLISLSPPLLWYKPNEKNNIVENSAQSVQPAMHRDTTILNPEKEKKSIVLPDGTQIALSSGSSIRFRKDFSGKNTKLRDVFVSGDVYFNVAPDVERPFTVYTGIISTRVLGTSFQLIQNSSQINVRLYTGKILISNEAENLPGWKSDLTLNPGTEISYKKNEGFISIHKFNTSGETVARKQNPITPRKQPELIFFNNEPLTSVFDRLSEYYNVKIIYTKNEVQQKQFSGKILHSDPVKSVLSLIADLNELSVVETDSDFSIRTQVK